jgi:hypothetical protein
MIAKIPFKDFSSFTEEILFTDDIFILKFNWNSRSKSWVLSIYDRDGVPIILGRKIALNQDLLSQFTYSNFNENDNLMVIDLTNNYNDIEYTDLFTNKRELIFYNE